MQPIQNNTGSPPPSHGSEDVSGNGISSSASTSTSSLQSSEGLRTPPTHSQAVQPDAPGRRAPHSSPNMPRGASTQARLAFGSTSGNSVRRRLFTEASGAENAAPASQEAADPRTRARRERTQAVSFAWPSNAQSAQEPTSPSARLGSSAPPNRSISHAALPDFLSPDFPTEAASFARAGNPAQPQLDPDGQPIPRRLETDNEEMNRSLRGPSELQLQVNSFYAPNTTSSASASSSAGDDGHRHLDADGEPPRTPDAKGKRRFDDVGR